MLRYHELTFFIYLFIYLFIYFFFFTGALPLGPTTGESGVFAFL